MTLRVRTHINRWAAAAVVVAAVLFVAGSTASPALAEPERPSRPGVSRQLLATAPVGGSLATLEADAYAIRTNDPYSFLSTVTTTKDTDSVFMRLKVFNPSGRLMTQRTQIVNDPGKGTAVATFERRTDDLSLAPGPYPVQLDVSVTEKGRTESATLQAELLIYDAAAKPLPVVLAARITGQPLADPQGRFVADPGQFTRPRDDTAELSRWILGDPDARLTLAITPLLLEEWKRISQGYEFAGPEGVVSVPASETVPVAYAQTLGLLKSALQTGRMEIVSQGLTDPDLSELHHADMVDDLTVQYAEGVSAVYASLESTPSVGTIPAGGCLPPDALGLVGDAGVGYAVITPSCTRSNSATATTGVYRIADSEIIALVTDPLATAAARNTDTQALLRRAYSLHIDDDRRPLVLSLNVGAGQASAGSVVVAANQLSAQSWLEPTLGGVSASTPDRQPIDVIARKPSKNVPAGYWDDVSESRRWAEALAAALGENDPVAATARRDSLVAQCSAWAGPGNDWVLADRGRTFADTATRLARTILDQVSIRAEAVTLAGAKGDVPVTITNGSDATLTLTLKTEPGGGVRVDEGTEKVLDLPPLDTFVEIPVEMPDSLSGTLIVTVLAGDVVLQTQTVAIRASHLDRLVMIGAVVIALGALLFVVVRRVRSYESSEPARRPRIGGSDTED